MRNSYRPLENSCEFVICLHTHNLRHSTYCIICKYVLEIIKKASKMVGPNRLDFSIVHEKPSFTLVHCIFIVEMNCLQLNSDRNPHEEPRCWLLMPCWFPIRLVNWLEMIVLVYFYKSENLNEITTPSELRPFEISRSRSNILLTWLVFRKSHLFNTIVGRI